MNLDAAPGWPFKTVQVPLESGPVVGWMTKSPSHASLKSITQWVPDMKTITFAALIASLALAACSPKQEAAPAPAPAAAESSSAPAEAPAATTPAPEAAASSASSEAAK
jgi:hypothetical protein